MIGHDRVAPFVDHPRVAECRTLLPDLQQDAPAEVRPVVIGVRVEPAATRRPFVFLAQLGFERMGESAQVTQDGVSRVGVLDDGGFANHRTNRHRHVAPGFAAFVPAVITSVVAKTHEDRQR
ncbi:hypothetical protein D3C71_1874990 [compost metagenome]